MQRHAPSTAETITFARTYPAEPEQLRCVRAELAAFLYGCPAVDDLLLVTSEFCANAVTHSRSGRPGGSFQVCALVLADDHVCVAVGDNGGTWLARRHDDGRPHGLDLVRALCGADNWGINGGPRGRVAWAQLSWQGGQDV
jgi:anti-sigma regulatory factor (Ser/Thr protein kinase)